MARWPQLLLTSSFLVVIWLVPVGQAVREVFQGEWPQLLRAFAQPPTEENLRTFESELEETSWFTDTMRPLVQSIRFRALGDPGAKALAGRAGWLFYKPGVQYLVEPGAAGGASENEAISAIIRFRDRLRERGIDLLVVPVPGKASIYPDMLTSRATKLAGTPFSRTLQVIAQLRDAGVEVVDLFEAFGEARTGVDRAAEPLYLKRDTHWSPEGVRLAAEVVTGRIQARTWAGRGDVDYQLQPVAVDRPSDIFRMTQVRDTEGFVPPEQTRCEKVFRTSSGEPYQDDPNSPVLVLGDSFSRIYQSDAPGSAGFIAHIAYGLRMPLTSIVNDGGASTLVRQQLSRQPELLTAKKLVIWEFIERDIRFGLEGWADVPLPLQIPTDPAGNPGC